MHDVKNVLSRMKVAFDVSKLAELAHKLNVSVSSIDSWRARGSIPEKNLLKTSQMSGVSVEWLLYGDKKASNSIKANNNSGSVNNFQLNNVTDCEINHNMTNESIIKEDEFTELCSLIKTYASSLMMEEIKEKLLRIKKAHQ
jgi:uncharacterized protein YjcR